MNMIEQAYLSGVRNSINLLKQGILQGLSFEESLTVLEQTLVVTSAQVIANGK